MILVTLQRNSASTILNLDSIATAMYNKIESGTTNRDCTLAGNNFALIGPEFMIIQVAAIGMYLFFGLHIKYLLLTKYTSIYMVLKGCKRELKFIR